VYPNNNGGFQSGLIKFGTSGGNVKDVTPNPNDPNAGCCIGTLGSLITDGTNFFILSNNHVLARSGQATSGENIDQPGPPATNLPLGCFTQASHVADFTKQAPLKPTAGTAPAGDCRGSTAPICGLAPSNVDAAIAQILPGTVDLSGSILDLGAATPTSIGDAPPSSQILLTPVPGQGVAKSGRTTGLTCSTIDTVSQDIVVSYDSSCGGSKAFDAVFRNQVFVKGGNFSAGGDSGSLIVSSNTAEPLALLFAGSDVDTIGNPIQEVLNQFAAGTPAVAPTFIPGNPDHPVSCAPTAQLQSTKIGAGQSTAISSNQRQAILRIRDRHASQLMASEPAIRSTDVGASTDSPGEGALVIKMASLPKTRIAPVIEGVRTKVEFSDGVEVPMLTIQKVNEATAVKQARVNELMGEHGIQGVGVGRSDDNPTETAIVVFTIKGEPHPPIPALIDGIRTRVVDSERFRAFGWNSQLEPKPTACGKARTAAKKN
jgi:hypothetical protein